MSGLQLIRQRRKAVISSQKITAAMKMIAISRMRKLSPLFENAQIYKKRWNELFNDIHDLVQSDESLPLIHGNPNAKKSLYILCGSNRGLCGSFNQQLGKFFQDITRGEKSQNIDYWVFGLKMKDFLNHNAGNIARLRRSTDFVQMPEVRRYAQELIEALNMGTYRTISVIYTRFDSFLSLKPTIKQVIPIKITGPAEPASKLYSLETPITEWIEDAIFGYFVAELYESFISQSLSEQVARMQAMDAATHNADNMIEALTLEYNRKRQENITKELIEIISGAESMKEQSHAQFC